MALRRLSLTIVVALAAASARAQVLYDGSAGTTPDAQGWKYVTNPLVGAGATNTVTTGGAALDTTAVRTDQAGYFSEAPIIGKHPLMPTLDRTAGYGVRFDLHVVSEGHNADDRNTDGVDDRAGYSIIALSSDLMGVEIAFWPDEVWAYDRRDIGGGVMEFVHDESSTGFNPDIGLLRYELLIVGSTYTLTAGGSQVLTGALRDYSGEGWPYTTPSFLFLGDDTSAADSLTRLTHVEVIPEPATLLLLAAGGNALVRRRRA